MPTATESLISVLLLAQCKFLSCDLDALGRENLRFWDIQDFHLQMPEAWVCCWLTDPEHRPLYAVMSCEIGGGNGLEPLAIGARMGLPIVDADFMGRAFPELQVRFLTCSPIIPKHLVGTTLVAILQDMQD